MTGPRFRLGGSASRALSGGPRAPARRRSPGRPWAGSRPAEFDPAPVEARERGRQPRAPRRDPGWRVVGAHRHDPGRAPRRARRRRRHGVLRPRLLRRRDRDPDAGPPGAGRGAPLELLQHRPLQPVAGVAAHRSPSAPDRDRDPDERRSPGRVPGVAQRPVRHARGAAAGRGVRHVPVRQVAPRLRLLDTVRRLADAPGLRPLLRDPVGLRELLSPDDAHARGAERRARGPGARILLHRRHHGGGGGVRPGAGGPRAEGARSSSTWPTPRRTGRSMPRRRTSPATGASSTPAGTICARRGSAGSSPRAWSPRVRP